MKKGKLKLFINMILTLFIFSAWILENYNGCFQVHAADHVHDGITFVEWNNTSKLPTKAGNYYLSNDVLLTETWVVPSGTINLCLNGMTITATGMGNGTSNTIHMIDVKADTTLNIYDCSEGMSGCIGDKKDVQYPIDVTEYGTVNLYGGHIDSIAVAVHTHTGYFNMYGGETYGRTSVTAGYYGAFNMYGGKIVSSGLIGLSAGGTVNIYDGIIDGSKCGKNYYRYAAICANSVTLNIYNVTLIGNGVQCMYAENGTVNIMDGYYRDAIVPKDDDKISITISGGYYSVKPDESMIKAGYEIVSYNGDPYKYKVSKIGQNTVPVSSVTLNKNELSLKVGESQSLVAEVLPDNASNKKVNWSCDTPSVATVDDAGKVSAIAVGDAIVTVTTEDGNKTAACKIKVAEKGNGPGDGVEWQTPADNWYEDYVIEVNNDDKVFYLIKAKDKVSGNIVVPGTININGTEYNTVLKPEQYTSVWAPVKDKITGIKLCKGIGFYNNDCGWMFSKLENVTTIVFDDVDTSEVKRMSCCFSGCEALEKVFFGDLNTSNVTEMTNMFYECRALKSLDVSSFDTSKVTDISGMFERCYALESVDVSGFNTKSVTDMRGMFCDCTKLKEVDVSGFDTYNVKNMWTVFAYCSSLAELDLSGWKTPNLEETWLMFNGCSSLKSLDLSSFDTTKVTFMDDMFSDCKSLVSLDISSFDLTNALLWETIFKNCNKLSEIKTPKAMGENTIDLPATFYDKETNKVFTAISKECTNMTLVKPRITAKKLTLDKNVLEFKATDDPIQLKVTIEPKEAVDVTLTWQSTDESVVTVSNKGLVSPVGAGNAIVSVSGDGCVAECKVTVISHSPMNPVPEISEATTELHLVKGQKFTLSDMGWESSNKKVISINKKGVLVVKKESATPIKLTKGAQSIDVYITKPSFSAKSLTLNAGNSQDIGFNYDKENLSVAWYSNAPDVATISDTGKVTAVSKGTATITAYINGSAYNCKIKVKEPIIAKERTLHLTLKGSKSVKLKGVKNPVWTADNPGLVNINKSKFTGLAVGETILRTGSGDNEYIIRLYVEDPTVKTTGITATGKNKYNMTIKAGNSIPLEFAFIKQKVVFKSNKAEIAYNDNGSIVANKIGSAKLTGKINGKTITINVTVN